MQNLRAISMALLAGALATSLGCDTVKALRAFTHAEPQPAGEPAPTADGKAALRVEVTPVHGITVLLDEVKVATASPYVAAGLEPGLHNLHVRAMGYLPITLPLQLKADEMLQVPVSLRPRPVGTPIFNPPPAPRPEPAPRPASLAEAGSGLAAGVAPLELQVVAQPAMDLVVDGLRLEGKTVILRRSRGTLQAGLLSLPYSITALRVLELNIPNDGGTWHKDGLQLQAGAVVRLSRGVTRVRRDGVDGVEQSLVLRRTN